MKFKKKVFTEPQFYQTDWYFQYEKFSFNLQKTLKSAATIILLYEEKPKAVNFLRRQTSY